MADNFNDFYEDISSSSTPIAPKRTFKSVTVSYENGIFKNIGKIIKALAFIVSIGIFVLAAVLAAALIMLDKFFIVVAIGVIIIGAVLAAIALFLIYGMGHIITQNDEILRRL